MDFRSYGGDWDRSDIFTLFAFIVGVALMFGGIFGAAQAEKAHMAEKKAYKAKCIDAGGVPTAPFDYVKGHGEGYLCINPSAIIEVN